MAATLAVELSNDDVGAPARTGDWRAFIVVVSAGFLCVATAHFLLYPTWTPRIAVLLFGAPLGLTALLGAVIKRDRAAMIATVLVGWSTVSALASPAPWAAFVGGATRQLSPVILAIVLGLWALARELSDRARVQLVFAVIAGCALSCGAAVLQLVFRPSGLLGLIDGRPSGLAVNPVYFGALMTAAGIIAVTCPTVRGRGWASAFAVLAGFGTAVSGSRIALLALGLWTSVAIVRRSAQLRGGALLAGGVTVGLITLRLGERGGEALSRVSSGQAGERPTIWRLGMEAVSERPFLGFGLGRFRPAVQGGFDAEFVRTYASDDLQAAWMDPHNVLIAVVVGIGVVGVLLSASFLAVTVRAARGPFAYAAAALATTWLLQPVSLVTFPLAMVFLGAASARHGVEPKPSTRRERSLVGLGAVLAVTAVAVDLSLVTAMRAGQADRAAAIAAWIPPDARTADLVSDLYVRDIVAGDRSPASRAQRAEAVTWARRAAELEPDIPYFWAGLAAKQALASEIPDAHASLERSLELQPWHPLSWELKMLLAYREGDEVALAGARAQLCQLGWGECEP